MVAIAGISAMTLTPGLAAAQPSTDYTVAASIEVSGRPEGIAVSPDNRTAFVTHGDNETGGLLSKIDTTTRAVVQTVPIGAGPVGLAVSPDGSTLFMGDNGGDTLSVIDTRTLAVRNVLPACDGPLGTVMTQDGSKVVVACQFDGNVLILDTKTNTTSLVKAGDRSLFVAVSPDGRTAYSTDLLGDYSIAVIDLASSHVSRRIPTGRETAFTIDVAESGRTLFFTSVGSEGNQLQKLDIATGRVQKLTLDSQPAGLDVAPDDSVAYVVSNEAVYVIDVATLTLVDTVTTPGNGQLVAVAPNSAAAYVTSQFSTVSVITDGSVPPPPPGPPSTGSGSIFGS
ncbi:YncE family protein [Rhodococcus sp. BP-241]|uniref:YncE family protein n=1 Tax=Rhodococcus sp. BP-241 TaxID=2739441 RepID=UPI001C9AF2A0|nr:YncE family protein [Rhodococcus sp. BP-241]MBY6709059.1 YncE family protein [Rhodococcus sp. BP-241]